MKWFLIVMTITNSSRPDFHATETLSKNDCFEIIERSRMQVSNAGDYGNATLIYCANSLPNEATWVGSTGSWLSTKAAN